MLNELTLFGNLDRVQTAIDRLKAFAEQAEAANPNGYIVLDSGGKDSGTIKALAFLSGVRFEIVHSHTTADHPHTVRFVREEQRRWMESGILYRIKYPRYRGERTSMWDMIVLKGPPTRIRRWCCDVLKKNGTEKGRFAVFGVRWAESVRRKNSRHLYEAPVNAKTLVGFHSAEDAKGYLEREPTRLARGRFMVNPIIDWTDEDVWEFHRRYKLPYNPLYDMGYRRVGCVGCPMGDNKRELEKMPEFKELYIRAFQRYLDRRLDLTETHFWRDGNSLYMWWAENSKIVNGRQLRLDSDGVTGGMKNE